MKTKKGEYQVYSDSAAIKLEALVSLNTVYALTAPKDYIVIGDYQGLRSFWIKSGKNKFLYYSLKHNTRYLNNADKVKVLPLEEINDLFAGK